jgi:hypothetical protein
MKKLVKRMTRERKVGAVCLEKGKDILAYKEYPDSIGFCALLVSVRFHFSRFIRYFKNIPL